ncbi:MAG TPA: hypothetical protein P5061_05345, partial [Mycobacterium sp.]|nr:hypothetical protein [Mycobacterium sp.]
ALGALAMALLGYAGSGELGNFGFVGVDQATFGPAVFCWFFGIGALTVAMAGGLTRAPKPVVAPAADDGPDASGEPDEDERAEGERAEGEPEPGPEFAEQRADDADSAAWSSPVTEPIAVPPGEPPGEPAPAEQASDQGPGLRLGPHDDLPDAEDLFDVDGDH